MSKSIFTKIIIYSCILFIIGYGLYYYTPIGLVLGREVKSLSIGNVTAKCDSVIINTLDVQNNYLQICGYIESNSCVIHKAELIKKDRKIYLDIYLIYAIDEESKKFCLEENIDTSQIDQIIIRGSDKNKIIWERSKD